MAEPPDLFTENPRTRTHEGPRSRTAPAGGGKPQPVPLMARLEVIVRVIVRLYLGLIVLVLPWLPFWTQNNLFTYSPVLAVLSGSGFVRGMVSGLGLLNIILAVVEVKNASELS